MADILSGIFLANVAGIVAIFSIALAVAFIFFPNLIQKRIPLKMPFNIIFILAAGLFLAILLIANLNVLIHGNTWYEKLWFLLQYSHFFSASTFIVIMGVIWWKRGFILALVLSLASFSIIEFICIPQHMILFGWILPYMVNWYVPFACDIMPFLVLLLSKQLRFSRKFYIFMLAGFLSLTVASYLVGYAWSYWDWEVKGFIAKNPLPETGFGFWQFEFWQRINKTFFIFAFIFVYLKGSTFVQNNSLCQEISLIGHRLKRLTTKQIQIIGIVCLVGFSVITLLMQALSVVSDIISWSALILATTYGTLGLCLLVKNKIALAKVPPNNSAVLLPQKGINRTLLGIFSILISILLVILLMHTLTTALNDMVLPGLLLCGALGGLGFRMLPGGNKKFRLLLGGFIGVIAILLGLMVTFSTPIVTCYQQLYTTNEWTPMYMWQGLNFAQFTVLQLNSISAILFFSMGILAAGLIGIMPSLEWKN